MLLARSMTESVVGTVAPRVSATVVVIGMCQSLPLWPTPSAQRLIRAVKNLPVPPLPGSKGEAS